MKMGISRSYGSGLDNWFRLQRRLLFCITKISSKGTMTVLEDSHSSLLDCIPNEYSSALNAASLRYKNPAETVTVSFCGIQANAFSVK